ncbi:type IV pilus biogenesis/stability protein PilW [Marinibacterium anthonyi]|nr:type IV pilus biogenesis/stability protein PilW [Marinibacterium anthonyi]
MTQSPATLEGRSDPPPSEADTREELDRVLASAAFPASDLRRAFLDHIVTETLAGRSNLIKGFTIAVEVFGRDESFDSQTDPVVRLEARRLRRDLDCYYIDAGRKDPVRIHIPKGGYVPQFDWQVRPDRKPAGTEGTESTAATGDGVDPEPPVPPGRPGGRRRGLVLAGALSGLAVVAAAVVFFRAPAPPAPMASAGFPNVVIPPFRTSDTSETSRVLSTGLGIELVQSLTHYDGMRLFQPPDASGWQQARPGLAPSYIVQGNVLSEGDVVDVSVQLLDAGTHEVMWTDDFVVPQTPGALIAMRNEMSARIASAIVQPYGPLAGAVRKSAAFADPGSMDSYLCVLQAHDYRRSFDAARFAPTLACLEAAVARQPDYSDAWALLGWMHLDAGRYQFRAPEDQASEYEQALAAALTAVALAPQNTLALKAVSSIRHHMGDYDEGERLAREALALNPFDPDTLAQLGWRLAARGKFDEAVPVLEEAVSRSVSPPGWYFNMIAIDALLNGDYRAMWPVAVHAAKEGNQIGYGLAAIAAAGNGDGPTARAYLDRMNPEALIATDPTAFFRNHGAIDAIRDAYVAGMALAREAAFAE